jgi:fermentation-respiration switch protein FrsA (DUF1100 family)
VDDGPAVRLLTKAISALPEREEAIVLAFLLERALPPISGPAPHDSGQASRHFTVTLGDEGWRSEQAARWPRTGALLLLYQAAAGISTAQLASELGLELDVLHAVFDDLSKRLRRSEPLGAVFGELSQGHPLSQAADNLGRATEELVAALAPSDALIHAVSAAMMARTALGHAPAPHVGYSPRGPLRTMPVRLPEAHYQRLKQWSEEHHFPMAVVVRGLVERFLDDQQPRPS